MTAGVAAEQVRVVLQRFPLDLAARSDEHHADLLREFALLSLDPDGADVPSRLLVLVEEVQARYSDGAATLERARDEAVQRGLEAVELAVTVPVGVGPAARRLLELLEEADDYCRTGEHLLTTPAPVDVAAYRRWYLGQFVDQAEGAAPTPWREPSPA